MTFVGYVGSASRARRPTDRSGRKHLITTYPLRITNESDRHRKVEAPDFALDLFGFSCASDEELFAVGHRFARNGDLIELDAIATGSGVLVVRQPQRVTVVTDLAGVWPVFYATVAGSLIYSSSAEAIAAQVGREVDTQWLTARLVSGSVPEMSMDLSGGLDSAAVVALAAATRPESTLPAITLVAADLGGDDPAHARQVATAIPGLRHLELPLPGEVDPYTALIEMPHTDEPFQDVSIFARLRWWMAAVNQLGSHVHLSGDGGDAVLLAPPAYLADLARRGTRDELRHHAADWARLRHRPARRLVTVATRLASTTRAQALEDYARSLEHDRARPSTQRRWEDLISWTPAPDCRHWFTQHARQLTAAALRIAAGTCANDGVAPGDSVGLAMVHAYGRAHRIHTALAAAHSVQLHAPYLDDAVITACLAVPAANRTSPRQAKPLLCAAMAGRIPESVLTRTTKGDYSMLAYRGLSRHHHVLIDLLTNSRLADLGLLDESAVRTDLARGAAGLPIPLATLDQVLGTELWLRTLPTPAGPAHHRECARA